MILRTYQRHAIDALYDYWRAGNSGRALISAPTGSGKSFIIAQLIKELCEWNARVLVLVHVKELIEGDYLELKNLWPEAPAGIYSASIGVRDLSSPVIFAGIQSIEKHLDKLPTPDVVIVDECHLIPRNETTRYFRALQKLSASKVVGLTATPYRLDSGWLHKGEGALFSEIVYDIKIQELIDKGYLCHLTSKAGKAQIDLTGVAKRGREFVEGELEKAAMKGNTTALACQEIEERGKDRKKWIIFACGLKHAAQVKDCLTVPAEVITGELTMAERENRIEAFKAGELRALISVNILTTGFNVPAVDLLAMLRPTESPSLYVQMVGRGMRVAPGKPNCLVLDFSGNTVTHGPVDAVDPEVRHKRGDGVAPAKECQQCHEIIHAAVRVCPVCGFVFPLPKPKIQKNAFQAALLQKDIAPVEFEVRRTKYSVHKKEGKPDTVRIEYDCGIFDQISEWIGFSTAAAFSLSRWCTGARLARPWPNNPQKFVELKPIGPKKIWAIKDGKWWKVTRREW